MADEHIQISPAQLMPRRNPGLISRIFGLVSRADPGMGPQPEQQETTQSGVTAQTLTSIYDQFFKNQANRMAVYADVDEMDNVSEEISVALDTIADNLVTSEDGVQLSFAVTAENAAVQKRIDETITSADLHQKVRPLGRNLVKYGDYFGEIVVNADAEIVNLKALRPSTMFRNQDARGNLILGKPKYDGQTGKCLNDRHECAYEQVNQDDQQVTAAFWPFQIVHIRHNFDALNPYGRSHLNVGRVIWRKLKALEEALIIGRLTRDLLKLVFYIDTTGLSRSDSASVVSDFRNSITQNQRMDGRRENPYQVYTDFFIGTKKLRTQNGNLVDGMTKVDVIDPKNEGIHNIQDIEYHHRKLLMTLRVPPAHLGWEQDGSSNGVLTHQDVQYVRWLRSVQQEIGHGLEQIFDIALVLVGIDPSDPGNAYEITWPALRASDEAAAAQTFLAYAQGDQLYMQEGVLAPDWIMQHRFNMSEEEVAEAKAYQEEQEQKELDQQNAQMQQQHQNAVEIEKTKASAHQDRDGQRKGDEGRSRDGKRIAPTKSKKDTPPGSGSRTRKKLNQEGGDDAVALLAEHIRLRTAEKLETELKALSAGDDGEAA